MRQGVCTGLREVLDNITREQLSEYLGQLLPCVQTALCDDDPAVRQAGHTCCVDSVQCMQTPWCQA